MRIHLNKNSVIICVLAMTAVFCQAAYAKGAYAYNSHGKRDPFLPLVGATAVAVHSIEDILSIEDVELQGVAGGAAGKMFVIINGEMIKEGETIGRLTIKEVSQYRVRLSIDENEHVLNIYEEGKQ